MNSLLVLLFSANAFAGVIEEDFSTRAKFSSGTAIWNQALGKIHPSLRITNYKPAATPLPFDVGDGSHGPFDPSTYAAFDVDGVITANVIELDSARFPILKVTNFHLAAGFRLETSQNKHLIIHSLSDVKIEGEIWCHGRDGGNAVGATAGAGGLPRCGGAKGGDGGTVAGHGQDGDNASGIVTGGQGGNHTGGLAVGGGGGGAWNMTTPAGDGPSSSVPNRGLGGTSDTEPEFLNVLPDVAGAGGAGGGGGSGTASDAGAGGGAGGGVVIIHAVRDVNLGTSPLSATGFIFASGGAGGTSNVLGGSGGGGGGGSVKVFAGGTLNLFNNDAAGASQAEPGIGGANGAPGRSWFTSAVYNGIGFYNPAEEAPINVGDHAEFSTDPETVESQVFDLQQNFATFQSLTILPASATFTLEAAGSNDNFASDDTGWTSIPQALDRKRYVKYRITIDGTSITAPDMVDSISLTYTQNERTAFKMQGTGCGRVGGGPGNAIPLLMLMIFIAGLKFVAEKQRRLRR